MISNTQHPTRRRWRWRWRWPVNRECYLAAAGRGAPGPLRCMFCSGQRELPGSLCEGPLPFAHLAHGQLRSRARVGGPGLTGPPAARFQSLGLRIRALVACAIVPAPCTAQLPVALPADPADLAPERAAFAAGVVLRCPISNSQRNAQFSLFIARVVAHRLGLAESPGVGIRQVGVVRGCQSTSAGS